MDFVVAYGTFNHPHEVVRKIALVLCDELLYGVLISRRGCMEMHSVSALAFVWAETTRTPP